MDTNDHLIIEFDVNSTPRAQLAALVATGAPIPCPDHPAEMLRVDVDYTVEKTLTELEDRLTALVGIMWDRCTSCPFNDSAAAPEIHPKECAALRMPDGEYHPFAATRLPLHPDIIVKAQSREWIENHRERRCDASGESLHFKEEHLRVERLQVALQRLPCPQCGLDRLCLTPEEARASFENFVLEPALLAEHVSVCRDFARDPKGVLLELGNTGTGKTHLAIAILRERLRCRGAAPVFIRHRQFMSEYHLSQRPIGFGGEPPESPLVRCQQADLLVYDELTAPTAHRGQEEVLLDLFDYRIGCHLPSVVTSNLCRDDLEAALGSRLVDRLRMAAVTVLEFGFPSRRPAEKHAYLQRTISRTSRGPEVNRLRASLKPRTITEVKARLQAVHEWLEYNRSCVPASEAERAEHSRLVTYMRGQRCKLEGLLLGTE